MNWDAIAAVGEVIGAIAVVATLLYIARDIRQNSQALSIAALRDTTAQWNEWSSMIATSSDLADIVSKGNTSYASLTDSEHLRYAAYVQSFFDNVESYRTLVIDYKAEKDLDVIIAIVARRIAIPGFAMWWSDNTADYDDDFVTWVNSLRDDI